jgi:hypothetical protein
MFALCTAVLNGPPKRESAERAPQLGPVLPMVTVNVPSRNHRPVCDNTVLTLGSWQQTFPALATAKLPQDHNSMAKEYHYCSECQTTTQDGTKEYNEPLIPLC